MTEPSQYFKGRTVQEQMNEVIGYVDVRSAEVATNAIAADVAQVHQDMLDADADASAAAASAAAAAGTLANAVKKTGEASQNIAGDIAVAGDLSAGGDLGVTGDLSVGGTGAFTGAVTVPAPVNNTDAANKKYVDDAGALDVHLAGNQTIADVKTFSSSPVVPTVATGTADTKAANGTKVKNELDNYVPMVRTTGNQIIAGVKTYTSAPIISGISNGEVLNNPPGIVQDATGNNGQIQYLRTTCPDSNGVSKDLMFFQLLDSADGTRTLRLNLYSSTGVRGIKNIAVIQPDGTIS